MKASSDKAFKGIGTEVRAIVRRFCQVWRLVPRPYRWALGAAAVLMALTSGCNIAMPLLLGNLVDQVKLGTDQQLDRQTLLYEAAISLAFIGLAYLVREGLQVLRRYLVENTCTRIDREMTVKLVGHLLKADLTNFSRERLGALHGRISRSVEGLVRFLRLGFLSFFPALATGAMALIATTSKQPWIGLVMLGVIPTSIALTIWQLASQKGVRLSLLRTREEMDGTVVEQLGGIDFIRAANTVPHEVKRVARTAERRRARENRHHFEMSLFGCAKALNEGLFHILVLALAIYLALTDRISLGEILTFSILFLNVMTPLSEIHRVIDEGHESSLQVSDFLKMLAEPVDRSFHVPTSVCKPRLEIGKPALVAQGLRVDYKLADGRRRRALDGIDLTINHGEAIGVAGRSGCGKSTWIKVLLRLIHPRRGTAQLGGVPLEQLSREDLAAMVGYVSQTPFVFAGTIAENIAYGNGTPSAAEIIEAAKMAYIHDEILNMPGGYEAAITERGQNLSGGQKQRLALARLFLKNPPILILDEGTSALDNISERQVQRALAAARSDRTLILVAHRLTTLRDADRIFVFDNGRIVETGTYRDLLRRGGVFTELVRCAEETAPLSNGPGKTRSIKDTLVPTRTA
jgi:ATP-binding cassette subfamily B protein